MNARTGAAAAGMGCLGVVVMVFVMVGGMLVAILGGANGSSTGAGTSATGLSSRVPAELVPWLEKSAAQCQPPLTPALLASQLWNESRFDKDAVSPVGARGIAQIMPFNDHLLEDSDGNGTASAFDVGDAIMAQGKLMCSYVPRLSVYEGDELLRYMLASYNAGPFAVLPAPCTVATRGGSCQAKIPPYPETKAYVSRIMSQMVDFAAPGGPLGVVGVGAWVMPVDGPVTASFHQMGNRWAMCGFHTGTDFGVGIGTPVKAVQEGTVVHADWGSTPGGTGGAYGNQVIIDHGGGVRSYYDHLSGFGVTAGQKVTTGQAIGVSGATGNVSGPHLHFEITEGTSGMPTCAQFVDPYSYILTHRQAATAATGSDLGAAAVEKAKTQLGVPYVYGGGGLNGPDGGGWDCSSLVRYAWAQASGMKIILPRVAADQLAATQEISESDLQPGDLVFFQLGLPGDWSHVGMYIGDGQMIHAPNPSTVVKIVSITSGYYANKPTAYRRVK